MPDINHAEVAKTVEDIVNGTENILAKRAMLVNVHIKGWGATKTDKKATQSVQDAFGTSGKKGKFIKDLMPKGSVDAPTTIAAACRKEHERITLPWGNTKAGYRLCPTEAFERWVGMVNTYKAAYKEASNEVVDHYERSLEQSAVELNGLFDPADYPTVEELRERYVFEREVQPVPVSDNFYAQVPAEIAAEICEQIIENNDTFVTTAVNDIVKRLEARVRNLAEALDGYEINKVVKHVKRNGRTVQAEKDVASRRLHDTMVTHLRDLVDLLPSLNIKGDARIQGFIDEVEEKLTKFEVDDFKQNTPEAEKVRADVQNDAADIADRLSGFFGPAN